MIQKLTLEQFREIKNSMLNLIELVNQNQDPVHEEEIIREYNSLQDRLLSSDLSDIPFEEWQGLYIVTDGELNLSRTHANIDFSLLDGIEYDSINLQGCNIRGIQALDYDETTFDAEYMKAHPEYFPDESIPAEVRQLFYDKKLAFSDLIEYPALRKCVNEHSFSRAYSTPSRDLIEAIGFENAIRLFDENPEFVNAITYKEERNSFSDDGYIFRTAQPFDKSGTYEEAKQFVYRQIIDGIKHGYSRKPLSFDVLPQEMIDSFPTVFVYNSKEQYKNGYSNGYNQLMNLYEALGKFSKEEILDFISKYGHCIDTSFRIDVSLGKEEQYERIITHIYNSIKNRELFYNNKNMPREFIERYPDIFLDENVPEELQNLFYQRKISPEIIRSHPEWKQLLQGKDIGSVCDRGVSAFVRQCVELGFDNDKVFELFDRYGSYLASCQINLNNIYRSNNIGELDNDIRQQMVEAIAVSRVRYDESARAIIGQEHPELFLDENAPDELKEVFYNYTSNTPLTFEFLRQHRDWLPYLEGKNLLLSLKKRNIGTRGLELLFEKYGEQEALRIGMKNPESVMQMLSEDKFVVLSDWYDKLHFVPHHVVMKEFPFEQADKFVASGKKWSQLMRIERHNINEDSKAALLKASMCFGVFDNDMDGFNKTMQLFSDIPKSLSTQDMQRMLDFIQKQISSLGDNPDPKMVEEYNKQLALIQQCYGQNENGTYSLKINSQQNKNIVQTLRNIMEDSNVSTILTADKAHKLFGGFEMKYEPDFRDFILKNMDTILSSDEYIAYISSMQKQWSEIKALNSNRILTLDLAMAFVKSNNYENVQVGNERLAEVSGMAGYDQRSFDTLQQIYNYGKSRTFSSIPRVHTKNGEYTYEILRLDDPLAVAIGTLTDCCQELGNAAETSMEHSMVDKNGRVFVIKDESGNIVAQSWVWRNQNVLCFDNIEIPAKAFTRAERGGSSRGKFTDTIFALYQQAGEELIAKDEEEFKKLLDEGKITEEQYEALKLGKVTVGTGYNDIADSLRRNSQPDRSKVARPLDFVPPINLNHRLYTADSTTQYVIAGEQDVATSSYETPTIYSDEFVIHDNSNTKRQDVLMLQKLELTTRGDSYSGRTQSDETDKIVSDIAYNYGLNPETTRIIMNANFAIIYDTTNEEVIVGDILYNTSFNNQGQRVDITDKVAMQIRMAIEQIGVKGKKFNISHLSQEQLEMCNKAMNLETEIDEERGLSHGAR